MSTRFAPISFDPKDRLFFVSGGGSTATAGGVVFHGQPDGNLQAYAAKTGDLLWQFQTGAPLQGAVTAYRLDGKDYVTLVASQYVWSFALDGKLGPLPAPPAPPTESQFSGRIVGTDQVQLSTELENNGLRADLKYVDEYALKPVRVRISAGDTVTWTNAGKEPHTPTARDGSWTAGTIEPGKSASVRFNKQGIYVYYDKDHPWSIGQLIVE
jgi:alcohol dehydrogenase (cytochrome c)